MRQDLKLIPQFDKDGDKRLNAAERKAAREHLAKEKAAGRGRTRPGRRGGESQDPPPPGPKLTPADVKTFRDEPLYDPRVLRTLFLQFENSDWEQELADFYHTDVEVPATLTVDGKTYPGVGVHFRGASSFFTVGQGRKRSLNLSLDFIREDQRLAGYRTLNLLNSHTDPTFLRTVLYYHIAREYIPAPKANYVRVVINGESWGVFINVQQFNKDFTREWFGSTQGARWKVPGSPRGNGGLTYRGPSIDEYKDRPYEIKSKDDPKAWNALIRLCEVLNETPLDDLPMRLPPLLDIEATLKFLSLENVFINSDGYWIRASDYQLYQDDQGAFHLIPYDANETFRAPQGPGFGGPERVRGIEVEPLTGADDLGKPLLSRLLAVPAWRARYLGWMRHIAEQWLDWKKIQPLAAQYQAVIAGDIDTDTRKLYSAEAFTKNVAEDIEERGSRGPRPGMSLKNFVAQRREFLLKHPDIANATVPSPLR